MSFVAFGEIMLRLTPDNQTDKIKTARAFSVNYAGSESNVASSLGILKNEVNYVTKLPANQLGDAALSALQSYGISTQHILRGGHRMGTYFIELGASIRPSSVIYDRANSAISELSAGEIHWEAILKNKKWLFLSGITPVLSKQCAIETIHAAKIAKQLGVKVSFDMNYRRSLWQHASAARTIFDQILEHTDLLFGNTGVLEDVYDFKMSGEHSINQTMDAMQQAKEKFGVAQLAFTDRAHLSASQNRVSGVFLNDAKPTISPTYEVTITDRFGTGDAFAAGCLHALNQGWTDEKVIGFATAAFALKHTLAGDQHTSSEAEIFSVMEGNTSGHVIR